eukprot:CAMPEP_0180417624 /NCGR_PEP_ID=MMETSP1036_2-20121128/1129_1 /TAXON_ID=632150 /ORGANISM="Azadinium spinosum, Strain 3D9" /LENGTH=195 /DNA_ID=CAMNT_0022422659 /DNA_START=353 /DNA_END=941 /DNA_ORIENTATION=+
MRPGATGHHPQLHLARLLEHMSSQVRLRDGLPHHQVGMISHLECENPCASQRIHAFLHIGWPEEEVTTHIANSLMKHEAVFRHRQHLIVLQDASAIALSPCAWIMQLTWEYFPKIARQSGITGAFGFAELFTPSSGSITFYFDGIQMEMRGLRFLKEDTMLCSVKFAPVRRMPACEETCTHVGLSLLVQESQTGR